MKIKLFCIPYAGGTASVFNSWKPFLDSHIEIIPIELAGKGKRLWDDLYEDMSAAVEDVFLFIKERVQGEPYMIFGHSMGSKIAYKLSQKIIEHKFQKPLHVFLSGSSAPHFMREDEEIYHLMENELFKEKIIELGGTPPEFFNHPELVEIFLPALKNDFKIIETAVYKDDIIPIPCDISVLIGKEDDLTTEERKGWRNYTLQQCTYHYFEGGHFFFLEKLNEVGEIINRVAAKHEKINNIY